MSNSDASKWSSYREKSRRLAETVPKLVVDDDQISTEIIQWIARSIELASSVVRKDVDNILSDNRSRLINSFMPTKIKSEFEIKCAFFQMLEYIESNSPLGESGGFIAVGSDFDAFQVILNIFSEADSTILVVEPYADEAIISRYAELCNESLDVRILVDPATMKGSFTAALRAWQDQYGDRRPLKARKTAQRALHDRAIFVDRQRVWTVSQSFKDLAKRSPAVIAEIHGDVGRLKCEAYEELWNNSSEL